MSRKVGAGSYGADDYDDDEDGDHEYDEDEAYYMVEEAVGSKFSEKEIEDALRSNNWVPSLAIKQLKAPRTTPAKAPPGGPRAPSSTTPLRAASTSGAVAPASGGVAASAAGSSAAAAAPVTTWSPSVAGGGGGKAPMVRAMSDGMPIAAGGGAAAAAASSAVAGAGTGVGAASAPAAAAPAAAVIIPPEVLAAIAKEKPRISVVTIGHVDAGKSTMMGHLLYDLGLVPPRVLYSYIQEAKSKNKRSFAFAWITDADASERDRGITMDVGVNHFATGSKVVTLLDAPGHRDFVPTTITAIAQADVAILVVDATEGEYEMSMDGGGQAREHALLARNFGITQLIVAVNKMDGPTVRWRKERFTAIKDHATRALTAMGFKEETITFVPVSGLTGINLVKSTSVMMAEALMREAGGSGSSSGGARAFSSGSAGSAGGLPRAASSASAVAASSSSSAAAGGAAAPKRRPGAASAGDDDDYTRVPGGAGGGAASDKANAAMLEDLGLTADDIAKLRVGSGGSTTGDSSAADAEAAAPASPVHAGPSGGGLRRVTSAASDDSAASAGTAGSAVSAGAASGGGGAPGLLPHQQEALNELMGKDALSSAEIMMLTDWYAGPTLIEALDATRPPARMTDHPLRLCVSEVYRSPMLGGLAVAGRLEGGFIATHMPVLPCPGSVAGSVHRIAINGELVPYAVAGDNVDVGVHGLDERQLYAGQILTAPSHPVRAVVKFKARIRTFPTMDIPMVPGQRFILHAHAVEIPCTVTRLLRTITDSNATLAHKPRILSKGTDAVVRIRLARPVPLERFEDHRRLGRFMLRYGDRTVAAGMVLKIKR